MPFKLGNLSGDKIFLGNTEVTSAFLGTQQVYSSGPPPFEIGTVTSDNLSGNLGFVVYSSTNSLYLTSNGSKLFACTSSAYTMIVREYNLSTPYNISTISLVNTFDPTELGNQSSNMAFSNSGNFLYLVSIDRTIRQYSLSTPFSLSSVSFVRQRSVDGDADVTCRSLEFNNDGTKMFVLFSSFTSYPLVQHRLIEYNLSTAYNIGTATINTSYDLPFSGVPISKGFNFNDNGSKLFISQESVIQQYNLSTPFSLATASQDSNNYNSSGGAFTFNADGTKLYVGDLQQDTLVSQYTNTF